MKKIFTLLFAAAIATSAFGQYHEYFNKLSVVGALTNVSVRQGANELEVVVPEDFDLSNVSIDVETPDGSSIEGAIPTDFSSVNPQTLKEIGNKAKTWSFTIKKLKPTTLPFSKSFANSTGNKAADWTTATEGWAFAGIDGSNNNHARYANNTVTFIVGFTNSPKDVSYKLQALSTGFVAGNEFNVEASADGIAWRIVENFNTEGAIPTGLTNFTTPLQATDRYVRWYYKARTNNLNLNDIVVDIPTSISQSSAASAFYQSAAGEITFTQPVVKAEVYSLLGGKTAEYNQPQGVVSIADGIKGIALVRVQLEDGSVITQKVVK